MKEISPPKLTKAQQAVLITNPNVKKVSNKTVQYTAEFKKHVLHKVQKGHSVKQVFKDAGIPIEWFIREYTNKLMRKWRQLSRTHGETYFDTEHRGQHNQAHYRQMSDAEKVKHLEMKVESLEYVRRHFQLPPVIVWKPHSSRRRRNTK